MLPTGRSSHLAGSCLAGTSSCRSTVSKTCPTTPARVVEQGLRRPGMHYEDHLRSGHEWSMCASFDPQAHRARAILRASNIGRLPGNTEITRIG